MATQSFARPDLSPCKACFWVGVALSLAAIALAVFLLAQMMGAATADLDTPMLTAAFTSAVLNTVIFTLYQATLSTVMALLLGFAFAWSLNGVGNFRGKSALLAIAASAFVLPSLVVVLGIVSVFGRAGWLNSALEFLGFAGRPFSPYGLSGILLAHIFFNAGIAAQAFQSALGSITYGARKQSLALGLGKVAHIQIIVLPAILPVAGALGSTIFLICFTSFAIVLTLGGTPAFNTLEVAIYEAVKFEFDIPKAMVLAMVQIAICGLLVLVANSALLNASSRADNSQDDVLAVWSSVWTNRIQWGLVFIIGAFFVAPILAVLIDGMNADLFSVVFKSNFKAAFMNSINIALTSAILCLLISWLIASSIISLSSETRKKNANFSRALVSLLQFSSQLYLVVPALVFGLGLFITYLNFGGKLSQWTFWGVVWANTLFAMPFAVSILKPALARVANSHDRLSASIGVGQWRRVFVIDLPLLRSDVMLVLALAFCFSLGDLGVIALFADDDFRTLPWLLYQHFGAYRTDEAAAIALIMMAMNLAIFYGATRFGNLTKNNRNFYKQATNG